MEWQFTGMPSKLSNGCPVPDYSRSIQRNRIICYEGDPRCDFDGSLSNNSCTFRTSICINNNDPRFPKCLPPTNIVNFEVKRPAPGGGDAADMANAATLEDQAGNGFGVTVVRKDTIVDPGSPNSTANQCSPLRDLIVPQKVTSTGGFTTGTKRIRIQSTNSSGKRDPDSLQLTCRVSTCGNAIIEVDHEQCDDGNRNNGDGCDQACQIETGPVNTPTLTPTLGPSNTPTNTPTIGPSNTPTSTPTITNTGTITPTRTPTGSPTNTVPGPSSTPTRTPTNSPTATNSPTPGPVHMIVAPGGGSGGNCRGTCVAGATSRHGLRVDHGLQVLHRWDA